MEFSRRQIILKYIIEDFIITANPVGSKYLIAKYNLPYSSATIRNEMAALEEGGFLEKTHTSSGRVPSAKGYEYYVKYLRDDTNDEKLKHEMQCLINEGTSIEDILKQSCEILSEVTNLASFVLGPDNNNEHLVSISLIPLGENSATAVLVTDKGHVENRTFILNAKDDMEEIRQCIDLFDKRLKGTKISNLQDKMETMKPVLGDYLVKYKYVYNTLLNAINSFMNTKNEIYGKNNLLLQPEFQNNPIELKKLFNIFNEPDELYEMLNNSNEEMFINNETFNENDNLKDVSVITKEIKDSKNKGIGKIAVIGPTRMDYSKVINYLEIIAEELTKKIKFGNEESESEEEYDSIDKC